ncbi:MAG: hypothetical protein JWO07_813 [Candidatus Saccharibacteria bacterium]|nr:hypothetical protein [Candidatus Saccharibacteria bacterium]
MNAPLNIDQRELAVKQQLTDIALTDREQFRTQAQTALLHFARRDRNTLTRIETKATTAYDVLGTWSDQLRPLRAQLEARRSEPAFRAAIKKQLVLMDNELDSKVQELIDDRLFEVQIAFLDDLYPTNSEARSHAKNLLSRPDLELNELLARLTECILYMTIADNNGISVVDPHSRLFRRIGSRQRVRRERRATKRLQRERLSYIARREKELMNLNGGLLRAISDNGWDLVTVISLRNTYDKRVNALPKKDSASALKRLAIFEKVTQQFRDDYVQHMSTGKMSLELTRKLTTEVDSLLLRIFDLSMVQKNQLLIQSREHRELTTERQTLLARK